MTIYQNFIDLNDVNVMRFGACRPCLKGTVASNLQSKRQRGAGNGAFSAFK